MSKYEYDSTAESCCRLTFHFTKPEAKYYYFKIWKDDSMDAWQLSLDGEASAPDLYVLALIAVDILKGKNENLKGKKIKKLAVWLTRDIPQKKKDSGKTVRASKDDPVVILSAKKHSTRKSALVKLSKKVAMSR